MPLQYLPLDSKRPAYMLYYLYGWRRRPSLMGGERDGNTQDGSNPAGRSAVLSDRDPHHPGPDLG